MKDGSSPAWRKMCAVIPVVVLLPCVPARATPVRVAISSPSRRAYEMVAMDSSRARINSGLPAGMAALKITSSMSGVMFWAACPVCTVTPDAASRRRSSGVLMSEPLTFAPSRCSRAAAPSIPQPPMPMKWTRRLQNGSRGVRTNCGLTPSVRIPMNLERRETPVTVRHKRAGAEDTRTARA